MWVGDFLRYNWVERNWRPFRQVLLKIGHKHGGFEKHSHISGWVENLRLEHTRHSAYQVRGFFKVRVRISRRLLKFGAFKFSRRLQFIACHCALLISVSKLSFFVYLQAAIPGVWGWTHKCWWQDGFGQQNLVTGWVGWPSLKKQHVYPLKYQIPRGTIPGGGRGTNSRSVFEKKLSSTRTPLGEGGRIHNTKSEFFMCFFGHDMSIYA